LKKLVLVILTVALAVTVLAIAETQPQEKPKPQAIAESPVTAFTQAMADRLTPNLQVKNIVGEPIKVGSVTIIPIMMINIGFGGGGGGPAQMPQMGGKGFYMSGEATPLGFVVISKAGTKFISAGKIPRK
jgi:uncharacterized spore protein YtfJ